MNLTHEWDRTHHGGGKFRISIDSRVVSGTLLAENTR